MFQEFLELSWTFIDKLKITPLGSHNLAPESTKKGMMAIRGHIFFTLLSSGGWLALWELVVKTKAQ